MKYIVYELWNPINNEPFYVGWSKRSKRPDEHIRESLSDGSEFKLGANPHKIYTIRKIINQGLFPIIKIVFLGDSKKESVEKEIELIKKYGRKDIKTGILTNMTDGGEGCGKRIMSREQIQRIRERKLGKTFEQQFGKEKAEEIKRKISTARLGYKTNKPSWNTGLTKENNESVKKISENMKGSIPYNKGKKMKDLIPDYKNHFLGKKHSDEVKKRISNANKGKCAGHNNPMYGKSAVAGRKWYNDGTKVYYIFPNDTIIIEKNLKPGRLRT